MSMYTLENDYLTLTADSHGGELHSLCSKNSHTEYLWNGDAAYWKYHAPLLFPIVGRCIDNEFRIDGKTYELPQHGFARISEFTCIEETDMQLTFELKSSEITRQEYPYDFVFHISYILVGASITTTLSVENTDKKPILFSFGAHPAFMCPSDPFDKLSDCYLEFSTRETSAILTLSSSGFISHNKKLYLQEANILPLSKELFFNDALIFDDLQSTCISIKSKNHNKTLTMDFSEFPYLGIWAPPKGAPFLCLEPWQGHADYDDFTGDFKDKEGIIELPQSQEFSRSYTISIQEPASENMME